MKRLSAILLVLLLCGLLLGGCGEEETAPETDYDYSDLTEPVVDLTITDCITEQQLTTVLGYPMHLLGLYDSDTQAIYQSDDNACVVTINLKNQTRGVFDSDIAAAGDTVTLYEGVGDIAYWSSETGELLVYTNGYALGVSVSCLDTTMIEPYTRQIAELMMTALKPVA